MNDLVEIPSAPIPALKLCHRILAMMAESNPRVTDNGAWQKATEGVARLRKDIETLNGFADVIVPVDFSELAATVVEDPRQLRLGGVI
jgi:hypothetical protein